jgi:2,2-dialkylglycine decarboxylase (pyruvate)
MKQMDAQAARLRKSAEKHLLFYGRDFSDVIIARGLGSYIYDINGRAILDFSSGQMCATLGHNHPAIVEAISKACKEIIHLDSIKLSPAVLELAERLTDILPKELQKCMFLSTGSEANEAAIRLSKLHTGGFEIAALDGSWHGMTAGSQSSTFASGRRGYGPSQSGSYLLPAPNSYRCPIRHCDRQCDCTCLNVGLDLLNSWSVGAGCAVIAEPIQSANGIIVPPEFYLKTLRDFCTKNGLLLIFDEAQTGLGRTGANFAFETEGVIPDIITLSKTLGAGLPLSSIVTSDALANSAKEKRFSFFTSHVSDPLPAQVGIAVLRLLISEKLAERAQAIGAYLKAGLLELQKKFTCIGDVRGRGLLIGVELVEDPTTRIPAHDLMQRVTRKCLELGLNLNKAGGRNAVWRIAPPLTVSYEETDTALSILESALRECEVG